VRQALEPVRRELARTPQAREKPAFLWVGFGIDDERAAKAVPVKFTAKP
jgi:hypothetical protein